MATNCKTLEGVATMEKQATSITVHLGAEMIQRVDAAARRAIVRGDLPIRCGRAGWAQRILVAALLAEEASVSPDELQKRVA